MHLYSWALSLFFFSKFKGRALGGDLHTSRSDRAPLPRQAEVCASLRDPVRARVMCNVRSVDCDMITACFLPLERAKV